MEEVRRGLHRVVVTDRKSGQVTGIVDVVSFDPKMIVLETQDGMLQITGQELHVSRLSLEKGEIDIDGRIDCMKYSGQEPVKAESLFVRLFG